MTFILTPFANESEFSDPDLVGEWASALSQKLAKPQVEPWCDYVVRRAGSVVGLAGFKAPRDDAGYVEIGYLTLRPFEGQGVARAATENLIAIARAHGAAGVFAHTLGAPNASTRVLEQNAFVRVAEVQNDDVGLTWRWERQL